MMADQIDKMVQRTYRSYYDDGLAELAIGFLFALVGGGLLGWRHPDDTIRTTVIIAMTLVILVAPFMVKWLLEQLKERVTYPRTGYVAFKREDRSGIRWLVIFAALALATAVIFLPETLNQIAFMVGALLAVVLILLGYRGGVWRFYVVALVALALGIATPYLLPDEIAATAATFAGAGVALVLSGGLTLAIYLRRYPEAEVE